MSIVQRSFSNFRFENTKVFHFFCLFPLPGLLLLFIAKYPYSYDIKITDFNVLNTSSGMIADLIYKKQNELATKAQRRKDIYPQITQIKTD